MGLFSSKKKVTVDDMAMQAMFAAVDVIGKIKNFEDVDDQKAMAINTGYFYGFLKLHLNSITRLNTVNLIIEKSIINFENATKRKAEFANFGHMIRVSFANALMSIENEIKKRPENPFLGVATDCLIELYNNPSSIDVDKMLTVAGNMKLLYEITSSLSKDIKIVD